MKKMNFLKRTGFMLILLSAFVTLSSSGGGGGKGSGGKGTSKGPGGGSTVTCGAKTARLYLHQGNMNPMAVPGRQSNYGTPQPIQNILNGGQPKSATSLYTDIQTKDYCFITITAMNCNDYGTGGTKTYIWDSNNDGNAFDVAMNIEIPKSGSFTITIDYHETCGPYYTNFSYKRALWAHQATYQPANVIQVSTWLFSRAESC